MIAAVKGWRAVCAALAFFLPPSAPAADDVNGAVRELARKTAGFAGRGETVSLAWSDISSLGPAGSAEARSALESALQEAGLRITEVVPTVDVQVTVSENASQYLLVEEARKGGERQVWIANWKRGGGAGAAPLAARLEKRQVWEQEEAILDVAFPAGNTLVLSPSHIALYGPQKEPRGMVPLKSPKEWPRDLRGHLRVNGGAYEAFLPGIHCTGALEPALTLECKPAEEPWVLESGSRAMLLANFAAGRNYFDGRVTAQNGLRKTLAPFFTAAEVEEHGKQLWLLAMLDGRTAMFDPAFDAVGAIPAWGSDIAGTDARCGSGRQVLATRAGDGSEPDGIQGYSIVNRAPVPLTAPMELPGPVTALWSAGGDSAIVVVRNLDSGKYMAYVVTVACGL
jgi:hypothetical protein